MFLWYDCSKAQKELGIQPKPARQVAQIFLIHYLFLNEISIFHLTIQAIEESVAFMRENGMLNIAAKSSLFRNAAVAVAAGLLLYSTYWISH
jgi:hypothetical protein